MPSNYKDTMFGLAQLKQEDMTSLYDGPLGIGPFKGFHRELNTYFNNKYGNIWYLKPFQKILRRIVGHAWDSALFENAKYEKATD